jgi:hypothetical protein
MKQLGNSVAISAVEIVAKQMVQYIKYGNNNTEKYSKDLFENYEI